MRSILKFLPMMALVGCMAVSCDDDNDFDFGDGTEIPTDSIPNPGIGDGTNNGYGDFVLGSTVGFSQFGEIHYSSDDTDFSSPQLRFRGFNPNETPGESTGRSSIVAIDLEIDPYTNDIVGTYFPSTSASGNAVGTFSPTDLNIVDSWILDSSLGEYRPLEWLHMDSPVCDSLHISINEYDGETSYSIEMYGTGTPLQASYDSETNETTYVDITEDNGTAIAFYYDGSLATIIDEE